MRAHKDTAGHSLKCTAPRAMCHLQRLSRKGMTSDFGPPYVKGYDTRTEKKTFGGHFEVNEGSNGVQWGKRKVLCLGS